MRLTRGAALLCALAACAPSREPGYLTAKAAGDRAYSAGRFDEARSEYATAAERAKRPRDREEALYLEACALARARRWDEAGKAYRRLLADFPAGERAPRAALDLAEAETGAGRKKLAQELLSEVVTKYPDSGPARRALVLYLAPLGRDEALAWLKRTVPRLEGSGLDENVRYAYAKELEASGDLQGARAAFVDVAHRHPYPRGSLFDDSLWHASLIDEQLGRPREAVADLEEMVAVREPSTLNGSYERPRFSPAAMRIAELYRDTLSDHAAARRAFHRVYARHQSSILRDDALWEEAKLARSDGENETACGLLRTLLDEFPSSRFVPCAQNLCSSLPAADAGSCHAYLLRDK
jgi:tetratricopeptide (TPR) repeat protein